jgi:homoserine kinase
VTELAQYQYSPDRKPGIRVSVPATTANLGPGFDVLALALELENTYDVWEIGSSLQIEVAGEGAHFIPRDQSNLFFSTMQTFYALAGYQSPGLLIREYNRIPLARGLGSSAATILAALTAARYLSGYGMDDDRLLDMACQLEGHGDNMTAAMRGGFVLSLELPGQKRIVRKLLWPIQLGVVAFIPELLVSTESAREVLPAGYSREDLVFNLSRVALLLSALQEGRFEDLRVAVEDRAHQPYRAELVPGLSRIIAAAEEAGAFGAMLSGAGPTVVALHDRDVRAGGQRIAGAMTRAAAEFGLEGRGIALGVRPRGMDFSSLPSDPTGTTLRL